jgi:hypothetical protein
MATATKAEQSAQPDSETTKPADKSQPQRNERKRPERSQSDGEPRRRPERVFRVGSSWATVWCNEHQQQIGPNEHTTRIIRSINLDRRFWNPKLNNGQGDWDSSSSYGLGDVHNAIAVLQLAADYLKQTEADVTRDA